MWTIFNTQVLKFARNLDVEFLILFFTNYNKEEKVEKQGRKGHINSIKVFISDLVFS